MNVAQETLGLRRGSLSLPLSLLMSAFALLIPPAVLSNHLHRLTERSPTARAFPLIHSIRVPRIYSILTNVFPRFSFRLDFDERFSASLNSTRLWETLWCRPRYRA
jgi:hypothetical protein